MKIVLTGGTGFIGSYVLRELFNRGNEVAAIDLNPPSRVSENLARGLIWIRGDVRDLNFLKSVIESQHPDVIINLAGLLQYGCMENPRLAVEVNVMGLANVLETARIFKVKRVVTASSSAAYGVFLKEAKENDPIPSDVTLYGATKFFGEILCRQYIENYGIEAVNLRYFGVYGPGQVKSPGIAKVLKDIEKTADGTDVTLPTIKETDHIHLVFVKDVALATTLAATTPSPVSLVYNIAGGPESYLTFADIMSLIKKLAPKCGTVTFLGKGRDRGPMDISLAQRELGYQPRFSPYDGFKESIEYILGKERD